MHCGLTGHLVQERLEQHDFMYQLNLGSPNSFRLLTVVEPSGEALVQRVVMRSASVGAMVDSYNVGGILMHVDETSGMLGAGRFKPSSGRAGLRHTLTLGSGS